MKKTNIPKINLRKAILVMEWVEGLQKLLLQFKMRAYDKTEIKIEIFRKLIPLINV